MLREKGFISIATWRDTHKLMTSKRILTVCLFVFRSEKSIIEELDCAQKTAHSKEISCHWVAVPPSPEYTIEISTMDQQSVGKYTVGHAHHTFDGTKLSFNETYLAQVGHLFEQVTLQGTVCFILP